MSVLPTSIDLFAGCGGFSTGLLDAGVKVVAGFENEARAVDVYNYNHQYRGAQGHVADLGTATGDQLLRLAELEQVDLVVGGPPCQSFSIIGKRRGLADERGQLLNHFVRIVLELGPRAFVLENVPNLLQFGGGSVVEELTRDFANAGYAVEFAVLPVADYGVAQMRKRLFMVGIRDCAGFPFPPEATHTAGEGQAGLFSSQLLPHLTASRAIGDLPDVGTPEGWKVPNHEPTAHSPKMLAAFAALAPGNRDPKSHHDRMDPDRPSYTLRAGTGNFSPLRPVHYKYDRVISVRESARVQGFDDHFIWPDAIPRLQQYRQVGNAVPPPVAAALARHIAGVVGWSLAPSECRGDPASRATPWSMTPSQRQEMRMKRLRGASLGGREASK